MAKKIIVGTRASRLALAQTGWVISCLQKRFPQYKFIIKKITTKGDRVKNWSALRIDKGVFVKEIENALLNKDIDLAVHSVKDMPVDILSGLELAAVMPRFNPRDALIAKNGVKLSALGRGAVIGTSSLRRRAQLLHWQKGLVIKELRGNLDTRMKKLNNGEFDAIVVSANGVIRMGWDNLISEYIPLKIMLPAPGQAALGIETRASDLPSKGLVRALNHQPTYSCISAERAFLKQLGGGCRVPVGALAQIKYRRLNLEGIIISLDGQKIVRGRDSLEAQKAEVLGKRLADKLLRLGGQEILEEARRYG